MAGTAHERGKYKVSKPRIDKYRALLSFFDSDIVQSQEEFNSRIEAPSSFKSFADAHYCCSTLHEVQVNHYKSYDDLPYKDQRYKVLCRKYEVLLSTNAKYFLTLACSCKEYSSNGFRCPEILATLSLLELYNVDAELGTLEPIKKKGRPKSRGTALTKDAENSPSSFPLGLVNEPIRSSAYGNGVIRSFRFENKKCQW